MSNSSAGISSDWVTLVPGVSTLLQIVLPAS
jgi:hypothetical protein